MNSHQVLHQAMIEAIHARDLEALQTLLKSATNVATLFLACEKIFLANVLDRKYREDKTLLTMATNRGFAEGVELLLAHGADTEGRSEYGRTALMYAMMDTSTEAYLDIAKQLLTKTKVDAEDNYKETALDYAIRNNNFPGMDLLIDHDANVNHKDISGKTLVQKLVSDGIDKYTLPTLQKLESAGADLFGTYENKNLLSLGDFTNTHSQAVCEYLIVKGVDAVELFANGMTELMYAIVWQDEALFHHLLKYGMDIHAQDKQGCSALMLATSANNLEFADALIKAGANLELKDNEGKTALLRTRHESMVLHLLQANADFKIVSKSGYNIVTHAVALQSLEILKFIKKRKISSAILNDAEYLGAPPIFIIFNKYNDLKYRFIKDEHTLRKLNLYLEIMKLLCLAGADPHIDFLGIKIIDRADEAVKKIISEVLAKNATQVAYTYAKNPVILHRIPIPTKPAPHQAQPLTLSKRPLG